MEIEGKIIQDLGLTEGVSKAGNSWKKKEYVLEMMNGNYPRKVKFHIFGQKADDIIIEVGRNYTLSVDLESREFNGRWYTDVSCYAARPTDTVTNTQTLPPMDAPQQMGGMPTGGFGAPAGAPDFTESNFGGDSSSDLPF